MEGNNTLLKIELLVKESGSNFVRPLVWLYGFLELTFAKFDNALKVYFRLDIFRTCVPFDFIFLTPNSIMYSGIKESLFNFTADCKLDFDEALKICKFKSIFPCS